MNNLRKILAGVAVAGLLAGGAAPAVADGGRDGHRDDKGNHSKRHDARKNDKVEVVVTFKTKDGHWKTDREDKSLWAAASRAKEKCHGGDWEKYFKDARRVDRTGKPEDVCSKRYVKVSFEQDDGRDRHHGDKESGQKH